MKVNEIRVKNFRLLRDVRIVLEDQTTVIVGRNNSGKTSLTELFRRLLSDSSPKFLLEDFSVGSYEDLWDAFKLYSDGKSEEVVREALPAIETQLAISYELDDDDLGVLSEFIIDLDVNVKEVNAMLRYQLDDGKIQALFEGCDAYTSAEYKSQFLRTVRERIPKLFSMNLQAIDPTDDTNRKEIDIVALRKVLQGGFINAQRGLDDITHRERDVLGRILEKLLSTAYAETAVATENHIIEEMQDVVDDIQSQLASEFNTRLNRLLPALEVMGYPGLSDPQLRTETTLDIHRLLENHTKIRYAADDGIGLPETYNGLGSRNLIYILFQLFEFFKSFTSKPTVPGMHIVFLEEPEAHLHPQMQEVFVRQLSQIVSVFETFDGGDKWPVQFIISTHSTHLANQAPFQAIRYFLTKIDEGGKFRTEIKDLRQGFADGSMDEDREFLNKYMTLTRSDLFFADKAMLIEGPTERLLMPKMIEKMGQPENGASLSSQYISMVEVGGAYAHRFFKLLEFLELPCLIITDLDSVKDRRKCPVHQGTHTSNATIKHWFADNEISISDILGKLERDKTIGCRHIAYEVPENGTQACGRSFEDAFMLANQQLFEISGSADIEKETQAYDEAQRLKKTNFALKYALEESEWSVPRYIREGLEWLQIIGSHNDSMMPGDSSSEQLPVEEGA